MGGLTDVLSVSCQLWQEPPLQFSCDRKTEITCFQDLLKRLKDRHVECAEAVDKKTAADDASPTDVTPGSMTKTKVTRYLTDGNVQRPSDRITSPLKVAQHLRAQFCNRQWKKEHMNMRINQVLVMYLDTDQIVRPVAPPDVSPVKGILSSYSFLFLDTPGHYCIRKYICWCNACSLVCGCR